MTFRFYAVKIGKKPGVYTDPMKATAQVKGVSGSLMKGFNDKNKARSWIGQTKKLDKSVVNKGICIFVDGSFNKKTKQYGSGIVILRNGKLICEMAIMGNDRRFIGSQQAAGEMFSILYAIEWAIRQRCAKIKICYDMESSWTTAIGVAKPTAEVSKVYVKRFQELANVFGDENIEFLKVKAHSNDKWNNRADTLARSAVGK